MAAVKQPRRVWASACNMVNLLSQCSVYENVTAAMPFQPLEKHSFHSSCAISCRCHTHWQSLFAVVWWLQAAFAPFSSALAHESHLAHALYEIISIGAATTLGELEAYMGCRCAFTHCSSAVYMHSYKCAKLRN